jgi:hypothetical protein
MRLVINIGLIVEDETDYMCRLTYETDIDVPLTSATVHGLRIPWMASFLQVNLKAPEPFAVMSGCQQFNNRDELDKVAQSLIMQGWTKIEQLLGSLHFWST